MTVVAFLVLLALMIGFINLIGGVPRQTRISTHQQAISFLEKSSFEDRARANRHLHRAFAILNPFVVSDKSFHDEYVRLVHRQLTQSTRDWSEIIQQASRTQRKLHFNSVEEIRSGVRATVMSIALTIVGVSAYQVNELVQAAHLIDGLWISAKARKDSAQQRQELYSIIRKWKPGPFIHQLASLSNVTDEHAVLSILIPAYETMYRVVLPVLFHSHGTATFFPFMQSQTSYHDLNLDTGSGYTYLALVKETLRLYPVVKRLKRENGWQKTSIDIEALHHEGWENSETFDPARWTRAPEGKFMPFGEGRGRCIANVKIVGMVVCIVVALIQSKVHLLDKDELAALRDNSRGK